VFAYRQRDEVIELAAGQERFFRLPPMTPGTVVARVYDAEVTRGPRGELSSHTGLASDLSVTLTHPGAEASDANSVQAESTWSDDLWRLRIRRNDGATASASYRIQLSYPSQLPVVERRIPSTFFKRGFDANWNQQKYIQIRPEAGVFEVQFDAAFSEMFELGKPNPRHIPLPVITADGFEREPIELGVGAGPRPDGGPQSLFLYARAAMSGGTISAYEITLDVDPMTLGIRLYPVSSGDWLEFFAWVEAEPIFALADKIPTVSGAEIKRGWERELEQATREIGAVIKPWFVGGARELLEIAYEPGPGDIPDSEGLVSTPTGHLVVRVVGDKAPRLDPDLPAVAGDGQSIGEPPPDDGAEPLFSRDELRDEEPDPEPGTPSTAAIPDVGDLIGRVRRIHRAGTSTPPTSTIGALAKIDHIVVLMQENRSFDHILGYLSREGGRADVDGLNTLPPDPATNPQVNRYDHLNYFPTKAEETAWPSLSTPGPGHEVDNVVSQIADNMGGFVASWAGRIGPGSPLLAKVMEYYSADQLGVYAALAEEFAICDKWFCAHPGPTWPNRFVLLTGDLSADANGSVEINNPDTHRMVPRTAPTLFDRLVEKGVSWRVFEHGYSFPRLFANWTYDVANILPFEDPDIGFEATARTGLPAVTLIEPDYIDVPPGNDDHPPADVADGQNLIGRIMKALVSSPSWEKTLFVITYDEHGGFYDHVLPLDGLAPLRGEGTRVGPRVPAFLISPLVARGGVIHTQFDHTSIGATILRRFYGEPLPPMSARMAAANDLREALSLDSPRPSSDFERFNAWTPQAAAGSPRNPALRNEQITAPREKDDFHAALQIVRLMTGNP